MKNGGEVIKERDIYGQPISLNYKGDDTFKTVPGGLLSILLLFLIMAYTFLKGKYMVDKEASETGQKGRESKECAEAGSEGSREIGTQGSERPSHHRR